LVDVDKVVESEKFMPFMGWWLIIKSLVEHVCDIITYKRGG